MTDNVICISLELLIQDIKKKNYIKNSKINIQELDFLLNRITSELNYNINYINNINKEIYDIRRKNIDLSNKLVKTQIELFNLKKID